jgi:LacI family transcriptional regulator
LVTPIVPTESDSAGPKYIHVSNLLASRIQTGEWRDGRIPTVREIAEAYGVSSFTASRALGLLQKRGLVVTKERSGCYARTPTQETTEKWGLVLRVTPGPWKEASEAAVRVGFDRVAVEDGERFFRVPFPFVESGGDEQVKQAAGAVVAVAAGVVFFPSRVSDESCRQDELFLATCREAGLPVVLTDRNLRGSERPLLHDLVASDHFEGGRECTRHLLDLGRRSIACVVASPTSSHVDREAGYLLALQSARERDATIREPMVLSLPSSSLPGEEYSWLADQVIACRADGVICYQDYTAVGLILELFRRGIRVPHDIAVVGCDDLPIGSIFSLGVTTYTYPSTAIARWAIRLLQNRLAHPLEPPVKILLPGKLIVRNSTIPEALASRI